MKDNGFASPVFPAMAGIHVYCCLHFAKYKISKRAAGCSIPSNTACRDSYVDPGLRREDDVDGFGKG